MIENDVVFAENLASAAEIAARLAYSKRRIKPLIPLEPERITRLSAEQDERIDAFLKRFEALVDQVSGKLFRGVAYMEQEPTNGFSRRDLSMLMEKLGVLESADRWAELVLLRNKSTHPDEPERSAGRVNEAFGQTDFLLGLVQAIQAYASAKGLVMEEPV